jgi:hypothetical protein
VIAQDDAGADEADAGHDALDHPLHHAAERVRMLVQDAELDRRDRHGGGAERDQRERAHADRLVGQIAVDPDRDAGDCRRAEPQQGILPFDIHRRPPPVARPAGVAGFRILRLFARGVVR